MERRFSREGSDEIPRREDSFDTTVVIEDDDAVPAFEEHFRSCFLDGLVGADGQHLRAHHVAHRAIRRPLAVSEQVDDIRLGEHADETAILEDREPAQRTFRHLFVCLANSVRGARVDDRSSHEVAHEEHGKLSVQGTVPPRTLSMRGPSSLFGETSSRLTAANRLRWDAQSAREAGSLHRPSYGALTGEVGPPPRVRAFGPNVDTAERTRMTDEKARVLLVDDEASARTSLRALLESEGCRDCD